MSWTIACTGTRSAQCIVHMLTLSDGQCTRALAMQPKKHANAVLTEFAQGTTPRHPVDELYDPGDPGDPDDPANPPQGASDSKLSCCSTNEARSTSVACSTDCCCNNADRACNCCSRVRSGDVCCGSFLCFGFTSVGDGGVVVAAGTWVLSHGTAVRVLKLITQRQSCDQVTDATATHSQTSNMSEGT